MGRESRGGARGVTVPALFHEVARVRAFLSVLGHSLRHHRGLLTARNVRALWTQSHPNWTIGGGTLYLSDEEAEAFIEACNGPDVIGDLRRDLGQLGSAFAMLYLQAINGVVCDPTEQLGPRTLCSSCKNAWDVGQAVLDRHDARWGNMYRSGALFQPDTREDG